MPSKSTIWYILLLRSRATPLSYLTLKKEAFRSSSLMQNYIFSIFNSLFFKKKEGFFSFVFLWLLIVLYITYFPKNNKVLFDTILTLPNNFKKIANIFCSVVICGASCKTLKKLELVKDPNWRQILFLKQIHQWNR